jgi:hypothetical protein
VQGKINVIINWGFENHEHWFACDIGETISHELPIDLKAKITGNRSDIIGWE